MSFKKILFVLLLFSCFFSVDYSIPPYNSVITFGIIGFVLYLKKRIHGFKLYISSCDIFIFKYLILFFVACFFPLFLNFSFEIDFIKELPILFFFNFFVSYLIIETYKSVYDQNANICGFILLCALLTSFQIIFSIISCLNPSIQSLIFKLISMDGVEKSITNGAMGFRPIGLGYSFFGAGIINSMILIMLSYVMSYGNITIQSKRISILMFLIIGFLGLMVSRTTIVGLGLSLFLLFINEKEWKVLINFIIIFIIMLISLWSLNYTSFSNDVEGLFSYGYEMFINYIEDGKLHTGSTDTMKEMYVFPSDLYTWLIGDGKFRSDTGGYYKGIDIGYLRVIYYGGLFILIIFFLCNAIIIKKSSTIFYKSSIKYALSFFVLFLLLNLKGIADCSLILFFMYHLSSLDKNNFKLA